MRLEFLRLIGLASLVSSVFCSARADDGASQQVMERASRSVVQVLARSCGQQPNRTASGFIWRDSATVVTAYHAVAGCSSIALYLQGTGETLATVERALPNADLALLKLVTASQSPPLATAGTLPGINDTLQVIGFYYGVQTLGSVPVKVTLGSSVLRDMLPDQLRASLQTTPIDLSTEILRINGSLVPGLSGAPLINSAGDVVGVGSGGLENGAAGIGWAIRARYLTDLLTAHPFVGVAVAIVPGQFASSVEGINPPSIKCGEYIFRRLKTRTLEELLATADDAVGFYQLASASGVTFDQIRRFGFAVYSEPLSGGSIAVPKDAVLRELNGECVASLGEGFDIRISSSKVSSPQDIEAASLAFEAKFQPHGLTWALNPAFTYPLPIQRTDGLVVRRKSANGFAGFAPTGGSFETIMARGNVFIGIEVKETRIPSAQIFQCYGGSNAPQCPQLLQDWQKWIAMSLGSHLSTFPPI
jgi:hypothetical protein